jgi:hypothetical protein
MSEILMVSKKKKNWSKHLVLLFLNSGHLQKCNKNNGMSILALGDRPRAQKEVLQVARGGTMPSASVSDL